ncbi:MAG: copper-binding protein [Bryobacterales bacterium]|nr:copper-binding protein [Bryobacterales bacterium]
MRRFRFSLFLLLALGLFGCGSSAPPAEAPQATSSQRYPLVGDVVSVDSAGRDAVIDHEKIADLMDAMQMGFSVPEAADLAKLEPGKRIEATLVVENNAMWLEGVKVIGDAKVRPDGNAPTPTHAH